MEDDIMRLEPRIARIEGEATQLNSRLAGVEVDIRDLRKSMDQKLDKPDYRFERLDDRLEKLDAKWDVRLEKLDAKWDARVEKLDAKIDRIDAKFEGRLEAMSTRRFTLLVGLISSAATIAATVLEIIVGGPHGH